MVTKKKVTKKVSKKAIEARETKNIISIVLGGLSILGSFIIPYICGLLGVIGIIIAYKEKAKSSKKLNTWAMTLNLIGVVLTIVMLSVTIFALIQFAQLPQ